MAVLADQLSFSLLSISFTYSFPVTPDDSGPLSPLHIPDEEDVDFSGLSPPSSPGETEVGPMLGLAAETRAESPS